MVSQSVFSAEKQVADLVGEDRIRYDQFRRLLNGGQPEEFYAFTQDYEKELKTEGYMMLYYKLKTNEGFFALGHRQLFRAMQYAEELDKEVREAGASDYSIWQRVCLPRSITTAWTLEKPRSSICRPSMRWVIVIPSSPCRCI